MWSMKQIRKNVMSAMYVSMYVSIYLCISLSSRQLSVFDKQIFIYFTRDLVGSERPDLSPGGSKRTRLISQWKE